MYDAELHTVLAGVGNGSPWSREIRSPGGGDNLFLTSIVALDPDTGRMKWYYQTTPGDNWDYTAAQDMVLASSLAARPLAGNRLRRDPLHLREASLAGPNKSCHRAKRRMAGPIAQPEAPGRPALAIPAGGSAAGSSEPATAIRNTHSPPLTRQTARESPSSSCLQLPFAQRQL